MKRVIFVVILTLILLSSSRNWGTISSQNPTLNPNQNTITSQDITDLPGVFKLITDNIQGAVFDGWKQRLVEENPDIALYQETGRWKLSDGSFDQALADINALFPGETPYQGVTFEPDGTTDGEAILSRFPIVESHSYPSLPLDDGSQYSFDHEVLYAKLNVYGMDIAVVTTHLPCCVEFIDARPLEQEAINNLFDTLGDVPLIYAGDLNSQDKEVNILDPQTMNLGTAAVDMVLDHSNPKASAIHTFHDVYRETHPDIFQYRGYTYFDVQYQSRIDYIFVNQHLNDAVVSSYTQPVKVDHALLRMIMNLNYETQDLKPPLPPTNVTVNVDVANQHSTISWAPSAAPDLFKYQLWRNKCLITDLPSTQTSFLDDYEYVMNKTYNYELTAVDIYNNTSVLSSYNFINSSYGNLERPGQPVLSASTTAGGVRLTWARPSTGGTPILYYNVYRSPAADQPVFPLSSVATENYTDTSISRSGITLFYRIRAYNIVDQHGGWQSELASATSGLSLQSLGQSVHQDAISVTQDDTGSCPATIQQLVYTPPPTTSQSLTNSTSSIPTSSNNNKSPVVLPLISISLIMMLYYMSRKKYIKQ